MERGHPARSERAAFVTHPLPQAVLKNLYKRNNY